MCLKLLLALATVSGVIACGGDEPAPGGDIGSPCAQSGATAGQCAGGVCGKPSDGTPTLECLKICSAQADCTLEESCSGVEGSSLKGCRPKTPIIDGGKK